MCCVRSLILAVLLSASLPYATAGAQSIREYPYEKICEPPGIASHKKLFKLSGVDANDFINEGGLDTAGYKKELKQSIKLTAFAIELENEQGRFYQVKIDGRIAPTIDIKQLVDRPSSHQIACVGFGSAKSEAAKTREALSKAIDNVGTKLILRKDLDNLEKKLSTAAPAQFALNSDRIANNTAFQSQFALATELLLNIGYDANDPKSVGSAFPLFVTPYIRHQGVFNSNNRAKDVDNLGLGLMATAYAVPLANWLNASFSLRGEYLTDTVNDKEIFASEATVSPFSSAYVRWPIELGQRMYFDEVAGGPSVRFDLWGRARYGRVEDSGHVATLQSHTDYFRLGFKASADLDLGGSDALSGLTASAAFTFFHNIVESSNIENIQRFETALGYAFTPNFGITIGYERGRNEDSLQKVEKIVAGVTIKFGDLELNKAPKFK